MDRSRKVLETFALEPSHLAAAAGIREKCCDSLYGDDGAGEGPPELKYDPPADSDGTFKAEHFDLTGPYKPALRMDVKMVV